MNPLSLAHLLLLREFALFLEAEGLNTLDQDRPTTMTTETTTVDIAAQHS
jgi:hypothetical protein